jgi:hypothetical protein
MSPKENKAQEFFFWRGHMRADDDLHEDILADGGDDKAKAVSRKVMQRLGFSDEDIAALQGRKVERRVKWAGLRAQSAVTLRRLAQKFDPDQPRDEDGKWTDGGGGDGGGGSAGPSAGFVSPSPDEFIAARDQSTRQNYLSPLKPEDLSGHTLVSTKDHKAGVAIDPKGDLQNLYNNGGPKGIAADLVADAISKGATTLDCYDGYLPDYYRQLGFVETGRLKFDASQAHGWDVNKQGTPDVVFMAWKGYVGGEKAAIARAKGPRKDWIPNEQSSNYASDYDAAKAESRIAARRKGNYRGAGEEPRSSADRAGNQPLARTSASDRRPLAPKEFDPSQPRDEHGRWTDGGGGDADGGGDKPAAVHDFKPGFKTPKTGLEFHHSDDVKKEWIAKSPIKTIEDVKRRAEMSQKALGDVGREIAQKLGIEIKDPGSKVKNEKGVARVLAKSKEPAYGSLAAVPDVARITFLVKHPEQTDQILDELAKHFEVAHEPFRVTDVNYADRAANVRLPTGLIGEVQMMEPSMAHAKSPDGGGGHDWYVVMREAHPTKGIKPDAAKYKEAREKQIEIYTPVLDALGDDWKALFGRGGK